MLRNEPIIVLSHGWRQPEKSVVIIRRKKVPFYFKSVVEKERNRGVWCVKYRRNVLKWTVFTQHTRTYNSCKSANGCRFATGRFATLICILTFCWPCISVYLSQYLTNLMYKIFFTISFISCLYMFRAHVLIIRRSKLLYTASGIITPIGVMIPEAV